MNKWKKNELRRGKVLRTQNSNEFSIWFFVLQVSQLRIRIEELEEELSIARQKYHENDEQNVSQRWFQQMTRTFHVGRTVKIVFYFFHLLACEYSRFFLLFPATDVSPEETSATQRQEFHTDDVNLFGIWSGALIGGRSCYIASPIVYQWQTKDQRLQRSNVNVINLLFRE